MIELTREGDVAILTMAHGKANALDIALCEGLVAHLDAVRASSARAAVITAHGGIFSAGVDLPRMLDGGPDYIRRFLPALHRLYETLFFFPKPVVAAVNGHAVAGGCVLACATDRRLMAEEGGRIGVTELLVGVPFPLLAFEIMRFAAASHRFEEVIFGAATYAPPAGVELGLLHEIVEPAALMPRALAAAETLAAHPSDAFALTKQQSRRPVQARFERDGAQVEPAVADIWVAAETADRIRAYVSRTFKKG